MKTVTAPWEATLTADQYSITYYFLVIAGFALLAYAIKSWISHGEVSTRYRPAVVAATCITAVAFLSYVVLVIKFDLGYDQVGDTFVPNSDAIWSWAPRYFDWSITVPLLIAELIAVGALVGAVARRMRFIGLLAAFLMIFTGYLGGVAINGGESLPALWVWGIISSVFFLVLYAIVIYTVMKSRPSMTPEAWRSYRHAMILLLVVWFAYPIVFGFQGFTTGGDWTMTSQIILCVADVVAKVGFGVLIHKVAKLRTAEDVAAGIDTFPEAVWISSIKRSDAALPPTGGLLRTDTSNSTRPGAQR